MVNAALAGGAAQLASGPTAGHAGSSRAYSGEQGAPPPERAVEALQDALRALPAARRVEMLLVKEALDATAREAAAADAAVAAVAKVCGARLLCPCGTTMQTAGCPHLWVCGCWGVQNAAFWEPLLARMMRSSHVPYTDLVYKGVGLVNMASSRAGGSMRADPGDQAGGGDPRPRTCTAS
jgi:hypothetical protein